ncbi:aspartate racemase [Mycoplana sp. BE70]|uniref:aspartate/glutamate racemase family protein n=1 Tax=Mycoplana sp. BE70 TaxID=2817775 RepID=UPI00285A3F58|nr:amino acid racemase [Mycoplana sp. BE70]MDR6756020.1 aspartate racemase [Mycoplana sp. BE70]
MVDNPMALIGLIGGMSWESSALYYRLLNTIAHRRLGGHHNARSLLFTLDFDALNRMAAEGRWDEVAGLITDAGRRLQDAGATFVMITAVSGHAVADRVETALQIPLLHIADPFAEAVRASGHKKVGLLGTRYTMEMDFFSSRLRERHGLEVLTPPPEQRHALHRIIVEELTLGRITQAARQTLLSMAAGLAERGAEAIAVACTELPLVAAMEDYPVAAYDVVQLHVEAALDRAIAEASA